MENDFKGRIIYSENYQSTIDSIKLINKSDSNNASVIKHNREFIDSSINSDICIIKGYEKNTKIKRENLVAPNLLSAYDESILELNSLDSIKNENNFIFPLFNFIQIKLKPDLAYLKKFILNILIRFHDLI